jgi:hypothetical protein
MDDNDLVDNEMEYMRIPQEFQSSRKKERNEILKYKTVAEATIKSKARYLGTSKSSKQQKRLPTAKQNGSTLANHGFTMTKKSKNILERKVDDCGDESSAVQVDEPTTATTEDVMMQKVDIDGVEEVYDESDVS